jgi:nucleotide-binding universal stress UspA family protein
MIGRPRILAGIDGTERGDEALAFAIVLAEAVGTGVVLAHAYGRHETRGQVHALLEARRAAVSEVAVEIDAWFDPSPARGLDAMAAARGADIIVVGPSHRAGIGLLLPGSTAQHLIHRTTRAVAVVPRGWRPSGPLLRIGCGYDGSARAEVALRTAAELARRTDGEVEVVRAFWSSSLEGPVGIAVLSELDALAQAGVGDVVQALAGDVAAHATALVDDPVHALVSESHDLDLLVLGSRGKGPLSASVTGSVSQRVAHDAACPVLIVSHAVPGALR